MKKFCSENLTWSEMSSCCLFVCCCLCVRDSLTLRAGHEVRSLYWNVAA